MSGVRTGLTLIGGSSPGLNAMAVGPSVPTTFTNARFIHNAVDAKCPCCPACPGGRWMADTTVPCLPKEYRYGDGSYDTCSYLNSPIVVGPNWGWPGGNFTYGGISFLNTTVEYSNPTAVSLASHVHFLKLKVKCLPTRTNLRMNSWWTFADARGLAPSLQQTIRHRGDLWHH